MHPDRCDYKSDASLVQLDSADLAFLSRVTKAGSDRDKAAPLNATKKDERRLLLKGYHTWTGGCLAFKQRSKFSFQTLQTITQQ